MSQPLLLSSLKRCYQSLDPSTYGSTIETLLGTLTSTPFPEEGPSPLSLQELALLSLLQDVVMAQCLLPCLLPPSLLRPTLYARFTRATPSLKALGVAGFEGAAEGILGGGVAKAEVGLEGVVQASVALLSHPRMDARLVSKHGSEVVAGALALRRRGVGGPFTTLSTSLPTFTMAEALLSIASGRFCPELHAVLGSPEGAQAAAAEAAASASASVSSPLPAAQTPSASGAALRVSAAGELCRLCCTSPLGVESITRAMFATVDTGSAVSVDRVRQRLAGIFTTPPLEVATPGEYFGALGPQLLGMLRLGGIGGGKGGGKGGSGDTASSNHPPRRPPTTPASTHHLAVDTAALTLAFLLKICGREHPPSPHASAIWEGVFAPMLAPLTDYIAPTTTTTTTAAAGDVISAAAPSLRPLLPCGGAMVHNEDAVLGCAEDLHKVLSLAPPSPGASALLTPALPALLDLYTAYSRGAKLRVGAASAAREVFGRVLGGCAPHVGARVCGMMLGLPKRGFLDKFLKEGTAAGAAAGGSIDPTVSAPLRSLLLLERDPTKAYVLGDNAGYALAQFPGPVTRSGVSLEEGGGLPSPTLLLGGRGKSGSGRNGGSGIGGGGGGGLMASLMSISSPSLSSSSSSSSSSATSAPFGGLREIGGGTAGGGSVGGVAGLGGIGGKDTPHSEDLGGINNPSAQESGERANALVDILGALPTKRQPRGGGGSGGGGRGGGGSTVSGVLFSALLGWQAAHFLSPQRQRRQQQQQQQQQQGLGLVVVVGGGEKEEESEIEEGGVIPALQLAVCLSERLGPRLLQGDVECTIAVRHTLCLAVLSTGLPLPGPEEVGCGREGAAIHREATAAYTAASAASAVVGGAGEGGVTGASSNPDTEELIATCLGLLTVLLTSEEEEEEGGEGGGGGNKGDKTSSSSSPPAPNKEAWLRSTLPLLAALASYPSEELAETATALRALILTRPMPSSAGGSGGGNGGSTSSSTPSTTSSTSGAALLLKSQGQQQQQQQQQQPPRLSLQDAMGLVMDPEPAVLSHGLRALADAVAKGDTTTTTTTTNSTATVSALLELSLRNLPSHDSYVYLAAMELLGALATYHGPSTLPLLLRAYSGAGGGGSNTAVAGATAAAPPLPPRVRVKLGEVLCRATASAGKGGVLPVYAGALLGCLLAVGPGGWREQEVLVARLQAAVASSSPEGGDAQEKEGGEEKEEEEMELGNEKKASGGVAFTSTTTTTNNNNNNIDNNTPLPPKAMAFFPPGTSQRDTWDPYNIALALRDCGEVRASALSTLGEVGGYLGASLATHAGDIVGGVCGVLSMERPGSVLKGWGGKKGGGSGGDSSVDLVVEVAAGVRRAAAVAVRRLVEGGGAFVTLAGRGYARELVGVMRGAGEGDEDERVRVHARDALGVVEEAMEKLWGGAT